MKKKIHFELLVTICIALAVFMFGSCVNSKQPLVESIPEESVSNEPNTNCVTKLLLYQVISNKEGAKQIDTYTYDDIGNIIEISTEYNDDGKTYKTKLEYDNAHNLTSKITYDPEGKKYSEYSWEYDEIGNLIVYREQMYMDFPKTIVFYRYDEKNRIKEEQTEEEIKTYVYEEDGSYNIISNLNGWKEKYDIYGNPIAYYNEDGTIYNSFKYDNQGNLISEERYLDGVMVESTIYEYNEAGLLFCKHRYSEGKLIMTYTYEYDKYGNLIKLSYKNPLGNEKVLETREYAEFTAREIE